MQPEAAAPGQPFGEAEHRRRAALVGQARQQGRGVGGNAEEGCEGAALVARVLVRQDGDRAAAAQCLVQGADASGVGGYQFGTEPLAAGAHHRTQTGLARRTEQCGKVVARHIQAADLPVAQMRDRHQQPLF